MNQFIKAVQALDLASVTRLLGEKPAWTNWAEKDGKNALHFLGGVQTNTDPVKEAAALKVLKLLVLKGMDINAIHNIPDKNCTFPATPLWYAYTRGRNEAMYKWLLKKGANPENCMFAIGWYDDAEAAALFKKYGANIEAVAGVSAFMASYLWKRFKVAEWFLKNGANVNYADEKGRTALYHAVKKKFDIPHVRLLLQYEADVNKAAQDGTTPLQLAARYRDKTLFELLNKAG